MTELTEAQSLAIQRAEAIKRAKSVGQAKQVSRSDILSDMNTKMSGWDTLRTSIGRGMMTVARGLGMADPEAPVVTESFKDLENKRPYTTMGGEVIGQAAPFMLPGGLGMKAATVPGRVAASTALGATEGGVIARGEGGGGEEITESAMVGGTVAGTMDLALPVIGRIGGKIIRRALGRSPTAPVIDKSGNWSPEMLEAMEITGLTPDDITTESVRLLNTGDVTDPKALLRKQFLESQGLVPTRAQVTGEASDFQAQQELFKTSGRVRRAIESQDEGISTRFENAITETGGSANKSNSTAFDHIADRSIELDAEISNAYRLAREKANDQKIIKLDGLVDEMKSFAGSDRTTGGLPSAVRDILRNKGVLGPKGLKVQGKIDAKTAEDIRIELNTLYNSLSPYGREKLASLKNALDSDVESAVGEDIFKEARKMKATFESDLSRAKVNKFDKRNKNLVRDILENKVNPDRFFQEAVLSKSIRSADIKQLKDFLMLDDAGANAWNDVRAEAMQYIKDTAMREVGGVPALTRASIDRALDSLGEQKLKVLFAPEELKFLRDMRIVAQMREPVRGTALGRGPSAQAVSRVTDAIKRLPLIAAYFSDIGEKIATYQGGRQAVSQPQLIQRLRPSELSILSPPAVAAGVSVNQTEDE